jgi:hypothetical protein
MAALLGQGYLFSRPLKEADFLVWMQQISYRLESAFGHPLPFQDLQRPGAIWPCSPGRSMLRLYPPSPVL